MTPHASPDCGTCASTLEARRERAVQRAITRACQHPSDARLALAERLQTLPAAYFEIAADAVSAAPDEYVIDGVRTERHVQALELLRDRYGLTLAEAEAELIRARREQKAAATEQLEDELEHLDAVHDEVAASVADLSAVSLITERAQPFERAWAAASTLARTEWQERHPAYFAGRRPAGSNPAVDLAIGPATWRVEQRERAEAGGAR